MSDKSVKSWFKSGMPWVWICAAAVGMSIVAVVGLLILIASRGLGYFWPATVYEVHIEESPQQIVTLVGERYDTETVKASRLHEAGVDVPAGLEVVRRDLFKIGNREVNGLDFRWVNGFHIKSETIPTQIFVAHRREWGNFYGYLDAIKENGAVVASGEVAWAELEKRLVRALELFDQIAYLEKGEIGNINYGLERLRLEERKLELAHDNDPAKKAAIEESRSALQEQYAELQEKLLNLNEQIKRDAVVAHIAGGEQVEIPLRQLVKVYKPNAMSGFDKLVAYFVNVKDFVSDEPREANTEGGIFPAIFGTVMLVIIMSVFVTPFGVVAAVYLREYAKQGPLTRLIRIAVNNLAGVPAIVYGVFGLGFFVYFLGGNIDQLFFPEALPAPTFGTPGILWASLTLAILTVPVVIVATEEGLARIPRNIREGSLALGATKWETLWRTVIPMASPAMMTGLILAIARAAGEVAPLMLVGVVKLAPSLPLDDNFPFLHLDRKFMHLGFHIHDVGFQSPNVEAARPLVYATALLLVIVILLLNFSAIAIRNHLREKYKSLDS